MLGFSRGGDPLYQFVSEFCQDERNEHCEFIFSHLNSIYFLDHGTTSGVKKYFTKQEMMTLLNLKKTLCQPHAEVIILIF